MFSYSDLLFFALSIKCNFAKKWPSLFSRFFACFIFVIIYLVSVYFYKVEIYYRAIDI